eukprot:7114447-Pyramimonas_sp.AAC.1
MSDSWAAILHFGDEARKFAARDRSARVSRPKEGPKRRWRKTPGPARAVVNALLDVDWGPVGPWQRVSDRGNVYQA